MGVRQRPRWTVLTYALAALAFLAASLAAKQAPPPSVAKSIVPENPSPHPAPAQPIPYSHKKHLALGLDCKDCHTNPEPGKLMTFPDTGRCMQCHTAVARDKPAIQKLVSYAKSKQAVPWVRVYTVLPGVEWSHRPHLQAGFNCETCHGQVREMEQMSEVTSVTAMAVCLNCHEANHAKTVCDTCHKA
jgi:cytochrome c7-like protein/class III cytochrome C family protein